MKLILKIFFLLSIYSCANIGGLSGGENDTKSPILIKSNLQKSNFLEKKIVLEFDEYITLNKPIENIFLIPEHSKLKTIVKGKKIEIIIDTILNSNQTYSLYINNGIMDNNQGNLYSYNYTFSTGSVIDSGKIKLKLFKDIKNGKIALFENDLNDSFKNFKPIFLYKNLDNLNIISGLKQFKKYNLIYFTDKNNDNKPDYYEKIYIIKDLKTDTSIEINPKEWVNPYIINKISILNDSLYLMNLSDNNYKYKLIEELITFNKTINYYNDSIIIKIKEENNKIINKYSIIKNYNSTKIYRDLNLMNFEFYKNNINIISNENKNTIEFKEILISNLNIINKPNKMILKNTDSIFYINEIKDSFINIRKFNNINYKKLSNIVFNLKSEKYNIKILNENKLIIYLYNQTGELNLNLLPNEYEIIIYKNNEFVNYNPFNNTEETKPIYYKKIKLKQNWEEVVNL